MGASFAQCSTPTKATRGRTRRAISWTGSAARLAKSPAGSARSACAPSASICHSGEFSASMSTRAPGPTSAARRNAAARPAPSREVANVRPARRASGRTGSMSGGTCFAEARRAADTMSRGSVRSVNRSIVSLWSQPSPHVVLVR